MGAKPSSPAWSKWANRWVVAAIVLGALAAGYTAFLLYDSQYPVVAGSGGAAKTIAGTGADTWLSAGYFAFIMFGPLAAAVTSLFYQHLEVNLKAPYTGLSNVFAWLHLVLMNVGVTVATFLMWTGGWNAANFAATTAKTASCIADPTCTVHERILGPLVSPIGYFTIVALLGSFAGGLGYVIAWRRSMKTIKASA